jgi:hypothetical protein
MTVMKLLKSILLLIFLINSLLLGAQEEYCCGRNMAFPDLEMPKEQERNISGFIRGRWLSLIIKSGARELGKCPHPIEIISWEGSLELDSMLEKMLAATQSTTPQFQTYEESLQYLEYIWKGKLELLRGDEIIPGTWEEAYIDNNTEPGTMYYEPGYVKGRWRFTMQLYNPQWDELVKEATTPEWDGDAEQYDLDVIEANREKGLPDGPFDDLYNQHFKNLKEIIWEYEKVPVKADVVPVKKSLEAGDKAKIRLKLYNDKGEAPKPWQRIVVEVEHGSLENGVGCNDPTEDCPDNRYAFMCDNGEIELKYVAPSDCNITSDHFKIFNTCQTRHTSVVELGVKGDEQKLIGEGDIEITCNNARLIIEYDENRTASGKGLNEKKIIRATVNVGLTADGSDIPLGTDSKYIYATYQLTNANLNSFRASYEYHKHTKDENIDYMCVNGAPKFSGILAPLFSIYYESKTGKAISAVIPEFGAEFYWTGSKECRSDAGNPDNIGISPVEETDSGDEMDGLAERMEQLASKFNINEEEFETELGKQKTDTTGKYPKGVTPIEQFNKNIPMDELIKTANEAVTFNITHPGYNDWKASGTDLSASGSGKKEHEETRDGIYSRSTKTYRWYFRKGK